MANRLSQDEHPTAQRERKNGILVLGKVKAILDALGDVGQAGPSEIAARIGANKSTTFRLMDSMESNGLLDRTRSGSYALGLRLMELGAIVESRLDLRNVAEHDLGELDFGLDHRAIADAQRADRYHARAIFVAQRQQKKQVLDSEDTQPRQPRRERLTDTA